MLRLVLVFLVIASVCSCIVRHPPCHHVVPVHFRVLSISTAQNKTVIRYKRLPVPAKLWVQDVRTATIYPVRLRKNSRKVFVPSIECVRIIGVASRTSNVVLAWNGKTPSPRSSNHCNK